MIELNCEVEDQEFLPWLRSKLNELIFPLQGRVLMIKIPEKSKLCLEPMYEFHRVYRNMKENFCVLLIKKEPHDSN